jgi:hypothetical protein
MDFPPICPSLTSMGLGLCSVSPASSAIESVAAASDDSVDFGWQAKKEVKTIAVNQSTDSFFMSDLELVFQVST